MRRLRQERYLSIRDLAKLAGVANYTVASAEIGKRPGGVRLRTIRKLAKALNVHPRELEAREDDEL
jgi:transcriptional regulator with XRE-family HTH domain